MSTGSWDESSNLVKDLPSPPAACEPDEVFDKSETAASKEAVDSQSASGWIKQASPSHKHGLFSKKTKASKGLGFLIKASKEGSKRRSKSPSKSPAKSPPKDDLTEDWVDREPVDENIKEKSEQWQAFFQMQDRIKQNVLKTQSTIGKLSAGRISPSGRISPAKQHEHLREEETSPVQWTNFGADDAPPLGESDMQENGAENFPHDEVQFSNNDDTELSTLITSVKDLPHFQLTPAVSLHQQYKSRRLSMEQENKMDLLAFEKPVPPSTPVEPQGESVDLLGLSLVTDSGDMGSQPAPIIVNEDLLGLDDFLSGPPTAIDQTGNDSLMSDWFMGSGTTYSSGQSSLCSSPISFDPDFLAEQSQFASDSTAVSNLARSLVDDFLQWGAEAEKKSAEPLSRNPFQSDSFQTLTAVKPDAFNPFATIVESDDADGSSEFPPSSAAPSSGATDTKTFGLFFTSKDRRSFGKDSADPFDHFECAVSAQHSQGLAASGKTFHESPRGSLYGEPSSEAITKAGTQNPFLGNTTTSSQAVFDEDFFEKKGVQSKGSKQDAESIWGTAETGASSQAFNPFQDDLFTAESIPTHSTDNTADAAGELSIRPINPFLTASFENIAANPTQSADFLRLFVASTDETDSFGASSAVASSHETGDTFDPFSSAPVKVPKPDSLGMNFEDVSRSTYDNVDEDNQDSRNMSGFSVKIQAEPINYEGAGGAVPTLPPPPKPPKSPQIPTRENPFDRDSPPEENFAKFQVDEESIKVKEVPAERGVLKSASSESSSPEEDESTEPLEPFRPVFSKASWKLMLRQPIKKKLAGNRYWKTVYVKVIKQKEGPVLKVFENEDCEGDSFQELPLQPCYSVSDLSVQQFDQFGKIHTAKVQYIFYRERVGIKPERITPSFVKKPKPTMVLDHSPQVSELLKFGSLDKDEMSSFIWEMEDTFMKLESFREKTLSYTKDEIQAEVWDEYMAVINKDGHTLSQKARVRVFVLAFLTGMPNCELGINDRTRKGKEVVGRHDIIPVKTEDWIRIENPEFHCVVDLETFKNTHNIRFHPLDACQFELVRFRVRPRENRELPLQMRAQQIMKDRHFEIRCDMLVTGYHAFSKKCGQFPCEDIEIRFKIPEPWVYYFRYERKFKYGSIKSMMRKPGKIKGLERITMMAQGLMSPTLMEASVGIAKYEHLYRSVVWRIPRLPERNQGEDLRKDLYK